MDVDRIFPPFRRDIAHRGWQVVETKRKKLLKKSYEKLPNIDRHP